VLIQLLRFLLIFLPLTAAVFFALSAWGHLRSAAGSLALASIIFYGYWSPVYVLLLLGRSPQFARGAGHSSVSGIAAASLAKRTLTLAVLANLCAIGYFSTPTSSSTA